MPYAAISDVYDAIGADEARRLTDIGSPASGQADEDRIQSALDNAAAQIDSYLDGRYALPFERPPAALRQHCINLAVYHLHGQLPSDKAQFDYLETRRWLENAAAGKITLGLNAADESVPSEGEDAVQTLDIAADRDSGGTFNQRQMRGWGA